MSPIFIQEFQKHNKCPHCAQQRLDGYSLCSECLDIAKKKWRKWSRKRKAEGKCCYCEEKSYDGGVRCWTHVLYNREKCKKWMQENKAYASACWKQRKQKWNSRGLCYCSKHAPLASKTRCSHCLEKANAKGRAKIALTKLILSLKL